MYNNAFSVGRVLTVEFEVGANWNQAFMLRSDAHHDSKFCNREAEEEDLKEAKRRDALIIDAGDLMDLMQGRYDPRRSYPEIRPEFLLGNYYDLVIDDTAKFYSPYAKNWLLMAKGNHENAVSKNADTDPNERVVTILNRETGSNIFRGKSGGWIRFMFKRGDVNHGSLTMRYHHSGGSNSEAQVTKGTIQTNRQATVYPDADLVLNGHTHTNYILGNPRARLSSKGVPYQDVQYFFRTPGYKWPGDWEEDDKGMQPKAHGCIWVDMTWDSKLDRPKILPTLDIR